MPASYKVIAIGSFAALAAFACVSASAQSDGDNWHPVSRTTGALPEVDAGAIAAAHPPQGEAAGVSTAMPMTNSSITREQVYQEAVAATHPASAESAGVTTSAPLVKSAGSGD
jgi:hypothetical protein